MELKPIKYGAYDNVPTINENFLALQELPGEFLSQLSNKADKSGIDVTVFSLAPGLGVNASNLLWKNQFGEVTGSLGVENKTGEPLHGKVIAIIPVGLRPLTEIITVGNAEYSPDGLYTGCLVVINPNGDVVAHYGSGKPITYIRFNCSFLEKGVV